MAFGEFRGRGVPEHDSAHVGIAEHQLARVHLDASAAADHHDPASARKQREVAREVHICQHLYDHIHALPIRRRADRILVAWGAVVENHIGTEPREHLPPGRTPARRQHAQARRLCKLHRRHAHAAGRAMHQHRLARLRRAPLNERPPGGGAGDAQCCALFKSHMFRQCEHASRIAHRHLRVSPAQAPGHPHALARLEPRLHVRAHFFHHARAIRTRRPRQRRQFRIRAGSNIRLHRIHARRRQPHDDLPRPRLRHGHIADFEDFRAAKGPHADRFHSGVER